MIKVRKPKKKSSASGGRASSAVYSTEEPEDLHSAQEDPHDSDSRSSTGEGHVSTPATAEPDEDAEVNYTPPPRPRLYAAAAPRPVSTREHHLQLAGRLYELEIERVINGQQEKLSELAARYYRHLLEAAPSPSRPRSRTQRPKRDRERKDPRPRGSSSGEPRPRCEHPSCRKPNGHTTEACFIRRGEAGEAARPRKRSTESEPAPSATPRNRRRIDSDSE